MIVVASLVSIPAAALVAALGLALCVGMLFGAAIENGIEDRKRHRR